MWSASLNGYRTAQLLACWKAELLIKEEPTTHQRVNLTDLKEAVKMKEGRDRCFFIQNNRWPNENHTPGKQHACNNSGTERRWWTPLASWLSVVNMYTKVISRSKWVWVVVKKPGAIPITIAKGIKCTQVLVVNIVPLGIGTQNFGGLDEVQGIQQTKMLVERRKECSTSNQTYLA